MNKLSVLISAALISSSVIVASLPSYAAIPLSIGGKILPSLAPMLENSTPAVVLISVKGTHEIKQQVPDSFKFFFGDPRREPSRGRQFKGLGSGVIIDAKEGYLVTNNHVVAEADEILITLKDGRQLTSKKIGADEASDIALLQIEAENLNEIKFSDSDKLRVGDLL